MFASFIKNGFLILAYLLLQNIVTGYKPDYEKLNVCAPGQKKSTDTNSCLDIDDLDVKRGMHWVANPPKSVCVNETIIDGLAVCEDTLRRTKECTIWSVVSTLWCEDLPDLKFERYWSTRCDVNLLHMYGRGRSKSCVTGMSGNRGEWPDFPRMSVKRIEAWGRRCPFCLYLHLDQNDNSAIDHLFLSQNKGVFDI